ncbi:MAG: tyrosine-type recombinase/integrase [Acidimicrobiia bacterium]|nr:tyrosine-type recombinase/integrase [Acidimicrobiia bacterium]
MLSRDPCLLPDRPVDDLPSLGEPLADRYLEFVGARCRPNTLVATASDLRVFFAVVGKSPTEVVAADVFEFITAQRNVSGGRVVRLADRETGLSARTIKRRLASVSGMFNYLVMVGEVPTNPVPRGLATRQVRARRRSAGPPLVRTPRTLPKVLEPAEVNALLAALRRWRDRAMVEAMVLGGLRCCEVVGLRHEEVRAVERRLFIAEGKGGHQRLVPVSARFFSSLAHYLDEERPPTDTDRVFVVLKGPRRGEPLSIDGLEQIVRGAKQRAGLGRVTCHQLRHTCLTRLREAGMALEALQAQAGHRSIESTRVYLHLANEWLAGEYRRATELLDATASGGGR